MASSLWVMNNGYYHLHRHKYIASKLSSNGVFIANKTSIIYATSSRRRRRITRCDLKAKSSTEVKKETNYEYEQEKEKRRVRILIAGGGIGGLVLALAAKKRGFEVMVFEKDLSAVRGEGRHRGPIQLLSSALGVLESIDKGVAKQVMDAGCVTGNRINGLADGLSGNWFAVGPRAFNNKRKVSPRVCDDVYEMAADSRSLVLRAKTSLMGDIKGKLSPARIDIFSETCFGSWLELTETTADPIMLYTLLDRQTTSDDLPVDDMYFQVGDHRLRFSKEEFCLVTGLRFGEESDDFPASSGFLSRTFGDGATIKLEHVLGVYDTIGGPDDDMSDLDAVRVCLMLVVDMFFLGRTKKMKVSPVVLGAIENLDFWNSYPWGVPIWRYTFKHMYNCLKSGDRTEETKQFTLSGFLFALKTWILETFPYSNKYFIKRDNLYRGEFVGPVGKRG